MRILSLVHIKIVSALLSALVLLLPIPGRTQWSIPTLDPKTYTSPSGEYTLLVDPEDRYAQHGANVVVRHRGQRVWSARMEVPLWNAGITNDGTAGGYGFSQGHPGKLVTHGIFHVLILDSKGKIRLDQQTPREMSAFPDATPNPNPVGMILDPENDRMVVRVYDPDLNRNIESWWVYRLTTAKPLMKLEPEKEKVDSESIRPIIDAKHVTGTPLTLMHSWRTDRSPGGRSRSLGARFTLIDLTGKPVWSMTIPEDYKTPDETKRERLMAEIREHGAILRTDQTRQFDLRFFADAQRVHFAVKQSTGGAWQVTEVSRTPYTPRRVLPPVPSIPARQLSYLGSIPLPPEYVAASSPVRDLDGFVVAGRDRFAFLRREAKGPDTFVVVNSDGQLIHQVSLNPIPIKPNTQWSGYIWAGGNRFLLTRSTQVLEGRASAWYVDTSTGAISPLVGFDCPNIKRIAAFPDGGFMTLNFIDAKYMGIEISY